jgi:hypothetical protein
LKRHRLGILLFVGLSGCILVWGCFLVTGTTNGYTQVTPEGGCEASSDCPHGSGQVCCIAFSGASCQMAPCGDGSIQPCSDSGECGDAGCNSHSCTIEGVPVTLRACGSFSSSFCSNGL